MRLRIFSFGVLALALSSCSSFRDTVSLPSKSSVSERFSGPTYHTHLVQADWATTFNAAKAALKPMDFRVTYVGPKQGKLKAISQIASGSDMQSARQLELDLRLAQAPDGTEVSALFTEVLEDDTNRHPGVAASLPVREEGVYEVFFQHLDEALAASSK